MKRALLVGINAYPDSPLNGCVNDVNLVRTMLTTEYGFAAGDITMLQDAAATTAAIRSAFNTFTTGVSSGDTIYFHYSGHGSYVESEAVNETDGRDEVICPVDYGTAGYAALIRDQELGTYVSRVPNGAKITIVIDACHSGTGLRNLLNVMPDGSEILNRFMPPPPEYLIGRTKELNDSDLNIRKRFIVNTDDQAEAILVSGCRDDQTSADGKWDGVTSHGALTWYMYKSLEETGFNMSYCDCIVRTNQKMRAVAISGLDQIPQLEGRAKYFNGKFITGV